jgi:cytoskeletal protein CcmA (bactofilin family)
MSDQEPAAHGQRAGLPLADASTKGRDPMSNDGVQWGWKSVKVEPETVAAEESAANPHSGTYIGSGALFEGTLSLSGDLRIDSEFRGAICSDGTIVIAPSGSVVGDLRAREVEIQGAVVGKVAARRMMILRAGARLHGDIETACLEIEKHGFFQGRTTMVEPQTTRRSDASPKPAATSASSAI